MMHVSASTVGALLCGLLGVCSAAIANGQGTVLEQTLLHDSIDRSFLLYQPSSYSDEYDWPLVLNLHGFTSNAQEQMSFSAMNEVAEAEGFLVAYPNAIDGNWLGPEDNVAFIDAVIDSIEQTHHVNPSHVYTSGMSQGGHFSLRVTTELPNTFAAVASVSAHNVFPPASFPPFPLLQIHGTADIVVPYEGGESQLLPGRIIPPVADFLAAWAENNGADVDPVTMELPDVYPGDNSTVTLLSFENGDTYTGVSGAEIPAELLHYRVNGGGHSWPLDPSLRYSDGAYFNFPLNSDINASAVIWDFFSRHELAAIPEPNCLTLAALAVAGLGLMFRRPASIRRCPQSQFRRRAWIRSGVYALAALLAVASDGAAQTPTITFVPQDGASSFFGWSVAVSGDTALVGAFDADDDGFQSGSAYLFNVTDGQQRARLVPDDGVPNGKFGRSVAISGNTALIGATGADDNGMSSGAAYLFNTTTSQQLAKLVPEDGAAGDQFGASVALSGNTALIESRKHFGSAYLFDATTGQQRAKLQPDDVFEMQGYIGGAVALSGNLALVGPYLFDAATGQQLAKFQRDEADIAADIAAENQFGCSVALSGHTALVGASPGGLFSDSGSAYLFDTTTGEQLAKFLPDDPARSGQFGSSVALDGNLALVGAEYDEEISGAAYFFDVTTGRQLAKLTPAADMGVYRFGHSVGLSRNGALIGTVGDSILTGSAFLYSPIPEPSTLLLTMVGVALAFRRMPQPG